MTWVSANLPMEDEVYLYYGGYSTGHKPGRFTGGRQLGLAKLRKDGYASLRADKDGGTLLTPPFIFAGDRLQLNLDASIEGAEVHVELQDASGRALGGFSLDKSDPIHGDRVAHDVTWRGKSDVSSLAGKPTRLHVRMRSTDLYSFQFRTGAAHDGEEE